MPSLRSSHPRPVEAQNPIAMGYVALGLVALLTYYLATSIASWYQLRQFKGPFLATFSWLWLTVVTQIDRNDEIYLDIHRKYKYPLVRIAPGFLVTDSADIIRHMNRARSAYYRDDWYRAFTVDPYLSSMLSTTDEAKHLTLKKQTTPGYCGREVPGLEDGINQQIANLTSLIRRKYISTSAQLKQMDFARVAQFYTLDAVTKIGFGKEWGFLNRDGDVNAFIETVNVVAPIIHLCTDIPLARNFYLNPLTLKLAGPKYTDKKGLGVLMRLSKEAVEKRFSSVNLENQQDVMGSFIRHGVSKEQIEAEIPTLIVAGSDTTAGVIRSGLLYLMCSPLIYKRLQAEIDKGIKAGRISSPITSAEGRNLPYLQAFIYESIRICPPNQILMPKVVPPGGDLLLGKYHVPAGTKIGVNMIGVQRDKEMFGEDVDLFRPERWMEADQEKRAAMECHAEMVFSHGRYTCSGKLVALMELNKVFVELLREFDFQLVDPEKPWKKRLHIMYLIKDMWVRVTKRGNI